MKQIIVLAAVFLTLFAASAGGTWYYVQKNQEEEKAKLELAENELEQKDATVLPAVDKVKHTPELSVPFRPKDLDSETIIRMADALRKREEAIRQNEQRLKQEQARLQFILQDMDQERTELNAIHDKIVAKISEAEKLLSAIKLDQQELNEIKEQVPEKIKHAEPNTPPDESANITKLVELYQAMESQTAARYMREICDSGKMALAAKVLNRMEKQAATDILVAMDDPVLVNQIVQEMLANPVAVAEADRGRRKR